MQQPAEAEVEVDAKPSGGAFRSVEAREGASSLSGKHALLCWTRWSLEGSDFFYEKTTVK